MTEKRRSKVLRGETHKIKTGCGNLFVTINSKADSIPFEILLRIGKSGGCAASQCEALGRTISLAFQHDVPIKKIIKHLAGISCQAPIGTAEGGDRVMSCADAISICLKAYMVENEAAAIKKAQEVAK